MSGNKRLFLGVGVLLVPLVLIFLVFNLWALVTFFLSSYFNTSESVIGAARWFNIIFGLLGILSIFLIPVCIVLGIYLIVSRKK